MTTETEKRNADLIAIKDLIDKQTKPARGAQGSRCEKALSNGTFRPARGADTCDGELCCGAARVPMDNGAWMTIETCGGAEQPTYDYQPPRDPLAIKMPDTKSVPFACI